MKKIISVLLCFMFLNLSFPLGAMALDGNYTMEQLRLPEKLAKKTPVNLVHVSADSIKILPYNTMEVTFAENFTSKTALVGDYMVFLFPDGLNTDRGTVVLPPATKLVGQISNIIFPKWFNKCAKVYVNFQYFELPDGTQIPVDAKVFGKRDYLARTKLNALGKGMGSVLTGIGVGIGAGCGIGAAAGAVVVGGFAIGLPVGFAIGTTVGLIVPGLQYKAKAGDKINVQIIKAVEVQR